MVTTSSLAFLFPGQGAQHQGMALDFWEAGEEAQKLFAMASQIMGQDMKALLQDADEAVLKRTDVAQPAITLANLSAAAFLAAAGVRPRAVAGFSLGEYAALAAAGVISAEDCFTLIRARSRAMQDAADRIGRENAGAAPGMAAILGLSPVQVEELLAQWAIPDLYGANFNGPRQVVVSGTAAALTAAEERFKAAGAKRVLRLQVAGPFHSPLIADAAEAFGPALESVQFQDPQIPLYSNVSGALVSTGAEAKRLALRQITEPVRWTAEEEAIAGRGDIEAVLEAGPGKVLQGLWKDSGTPIPVHAAGTVADIAGWKAQE